MVLKVVPEFLRWTGPGQGFELCEHAIQDKRIHLQPGQKLSLTVKPTGCAEGLKEAQEQQRNQTDEEEPTEIKTGLLEGFQDMVSIHGELVASVHCRLVWLEQKETASSSPPSRLSELDSRDALWPSLQDLLSTRSPPSDFLCQIPPRKSRASTSNSSSLPSSVGTAEQKLQRHSHRLHCAPGIDRGVLTNKTPGRLETKSPAPSLTECAGSDKDQTQPGDLLPSVCLDVSDLIRCLFKCGNSWVDSRGVVVDIEAPPHSISQSKEETANSFNQPKTVGDASSKDHHAGSSLSSLTNSLGHHSTLQSTKEQNHDSHTVSVIPAEKPIGREKSKGTDGKEFRSKPEKKDKRNPSNPMAGGLQMIPKPSPIRPEAVSDSGRSGVGSDLESDSDSEGEFGGKSTSGGARVMRPDPSGCHHSPLTSSLSPSHSSSCLSPIVPPRHPFVSPFSSAKDQKVGTDGMRNMSASHLKIKNPSLTQTQRLAQIKAQQQAAWDAIGI
uniref:Uncharacterized protein n=1 Tax=Chromera velia CCMP2878 TaxID=1169474 RepID=A0A0G4FEY3_9ALVE|eukprot:Cvel_16586.t1-p1 / transcript=Cvel_16586.t1 / gene=Cvel_16586 / organism=Chromera_velia_CCMP2878 / gene_product=hypothetical protein / transcript_product=hypothetical protein / location=Cvel_scaffold1284:17879-20459(+) / protein_length=496 / sequence_SO=supercontig / SO=protein_coding / is_pseudo=false